MQLRWRRGEACTGFWCGNLSSGLPRNFFPGRVSTNSEEGRENEDLGSVAP
jgi:hypothetical protein